MDKAKAIELVQNLSRASVSHYAVVNGDKQGSISLALRREIAATREVLIALAGDVFTPSEIEQVIEIE